MARDAAGNTYLVGVTTARDFPQVAALQPELNGYNDVFVTKIAPDGLTVVFSTYFGGSGDEDAKAIAVAADGSPVVVGSTKSCDFPLHRAIQPRMGNQDPCPFDSTDAFVAKLTADGSGLVFSTFFGGQQADYANDVALDTAGNIVVVGATRSSIVTTANAFQPTIGGQSDAFVTKFSADGQQLLFSTFLGSSADDYGYGVAVGSDDSVAITGVNSLPLRLIDAPVLAVILRDTHTGSALPRANGQLVVRGLGGSSEQFSFTTDDTGRFSVRLGRTATETAVALEYRYVRGYLPQFHDQALTSATATPVVLRPGPILIESRLLAPTTLVQTVLDDRTGEPIGETPVTITLDWGPRYPATYSFVTDAAGQFTWRLNSAIQEPTRIKYEAAGYVPQFCLHSGNPPHHAHFRSSTVLTQASHGRHCELQPPKMVAQSRRCYSRLVNFWLRVNLLHTSIYQLFGRLHKATPEANASGVFLRRSTYSSTIRLGGGNSIARNLSNHSCSGSMSNACSKNAIAIIRHKNVEPTASNALAPGASARSASTTVSETVTMIENGKYRLLVRFESSCSIQCRWRGSIRTLKLRTPSSTFSRALWCIAHNSRNVPMPT